MISINAEATDETPSFQMKKIKIFDLDIDAIEQDCPSLNWRQQTGFEADPIYVLSSGK